MAITIIRIFYWRVLCMLNALIAAGLTATASGGLLTTDDETIKLIDAGILYWSESGVGSLKYQFVVFGAEIFLALLFGLSAAFLMRNQRRAKCAQATVHFIAAGLLGAAGSLELWYGTGWDYVSLFKISVSVHFTSWIGAGIFLLAAMLLSFVDGIVMASGSGEQDMPTIVAS